MNGREKLTEVIERLHRDHREYRAQGNYTAASIISIKIEAMEYARSLAFDGAPLPE